MGQDGGAFSQNLTRLSCFVDDVVCSVGKLIVATEAGQEAILQRIDDTAKANGVTDLRRVGRDEARAMEPHVHCTQVGTGRGGGR